jgi:glycogen operon protein
LQLLKADCAPGRWRQRGKSFPLGATLVPGGANFSVFAKHSTAAQLLLFEAADAANAFRVIDLDPRTDRTYHYWHAFVSGVKIWNGPLID